MGRVWTAFGAFFGLTTVAMAAYQAHGLAGGAAANVASAVQMQGLHAVALLFVGQRGSRVDVNFAGLAFTVGVILFCGTVYAGAIPAFEFLHVGRLAPIGGTTLMIGWLALLVSAMRR